MYDNIAEAPDELAFRKDDILTVLEQNTAGLEGWWLCSLRGRQVNFLYNLRLYYVLYFIILYFSRGYVLEIA